MRILITGGAGFIGSCFVRHMLKKHQDYKIINIDALTYAGNIANLDDVKNNPNYTFDHGNICDKKLVREIIDTASTNNIRYQIKRAAYGGNDAGTIHISGDGIPTAVISVPCRYIHSPVCVADYSDYENMKALLDAYLRNRNNI